MADLRISQVIPTVKCSNCQHQVNVHDLATHVCTHVPTLPPIIDTSTATVRKQNEKKLSFTRGPLSPSSKFSFNILSKLGKKPTSLTENHAITPYSVVDKQSAQPLSQSTHGTRENSRQMPPTPITPSFTNSKPPTPYGGNPIPSSRSTSSEEQSPVTPVRDGGFPPVSFKSSGRHCARCKRGLAATTQCVEVNSQVYHTQCFTCFLCRIRLDPRQPPHALEKRIYCEEDYDIVIKRPTCSGCQQPIEHHERPTKALGRYYHPEHIRCHHCHKPVDPDTTGVVERKGKVYCRPDFNLLYLPKCQACGKAVEKEAVSSADGKLKGQWHKHCFRCHLCHCEFPDNTFYIYGNAPYCRRDYHKMNQSLCRACDQPVEGRCAKTSEGWRFHPQCFTCYVCHCQIQDVYYLQENRIYCPQDRKIRSEKRHTHFQQP